ncbi:hypothetical protein WMY93_022716 [Mugilogobius chulae]|uniref:Uncharacterized protein n=1 Tax=Mugilogobius chulae TaxID=88201 RepID=A0AAW0NBW9_9GOBI
MLSLPHHCTRPHGCDMLGDAPLLTDVSLQQPLSRSARSLVSLCVPAPRPPRVRCRPRPHTLATVTVPTSICSLIRPLPRPLPLSAPKLFPLPVGWSVYRSSRLGFTLSDLPGSPTLAVSAVQHGTTDVPPPPCAADTDAVRAPLCMPNQENPGPKDEAQIQLTLFRLDCLTLPPWPPLSFAFACF